MQLVKSKITMAKRDTLNQRPLWFDVSGAEEILTRALHANYTGVVLTLPDLERLAPLLGDRLTVVLRISNLEELETAFLRDVKKTRNLVVLSNQTDILKSARNEGFETAYMGHVVDAKSLHDSITIGTEHPYLVLSFKDPTNIPLELVIASLQNSNTILVKEIAPDDLDDAIVTLGVMEVGAEGILFSPKTHGVMDKFLERWNTSLHQTVSLAVAKVVRAVPVGMGYRSCIDLTTLFTPTEGMVVGSTSQGGILCCPEVFHLPYMELRPFRVNAGAVHSYIFNTGNRTDYMTELRAGSPVMVVDASGKTRVAYVGRMKTEVRPLRLIEVAFKDETRANILLQDDWHVRVYSSTAQPLNITELRPGDEVMAYQTDPGRHVGIKVSEHILEV